MATSSRRRRDAGHLVLGTTADLLRRLEDGPAALPIPLLVVRVRDLERIAWRQGRAAARALERRTVKLFIETASKTLRTHDVLAHDGEREDFLAALVSPTRGGVPAVAADCRTTLARLASAMEYGSGLSVETGWTVLQQALDGGGLAIAIDRALARGARERERYEFFSTIGHELRTPITSLRGYLETLLDDDLDPTTHRRFLEVARSEATRLGRLVDGLFDVSVWDMRADGARQEESSVAATLEAVCGSVAPIAVARSVVVERIPFDDVRVSLGTDRLMHIASNVVENAVKHGNEGGRVRIDMVSADARFIEIIVDDDGPGVAPAEREAIFALARRGSNVRASGSGIGLAVVRLMIERAGGEASVADSPLGGARFRLRLPRSRDAADATES